MLVDTANARRALIARMPGSQVCEKDREAERAPERTDGQTSQHSSVSAKPFCVSVFVLMAFASHCQTFLQSAAEKVLASPHSIQGWEKNLLWFSGISLNQSSIVLGDAWPRTQ